MRLFVDLDGTAAEFKTVDTLETLYEKGYFLNLKPHDSIIEAIRLIIKNNPEIEVNILSSVLADSKYALEEKNAWIDKFLPEIKPENRIFPPCGANKRDYIDGGVTEHDFLLDDYSLNLNEWEPPARGIKIMNGINGTKGTWTSDKLSIERNGLDLAEKIVNIMKGKEHVMDSGPTKIDEENSSFAKTLNWLLAHDNQYKYAMLDRMKQDCLYFLGNGNRLEKYLWADTKHEQIDFMNALYDSFLDEDKPEWISKKEIEKFAHDMLDTWEVTDVNLSHDGYAYADIVVSEYRNGKMDEFKTWGYFRVYDAANGQPMVLQKIDDDIFMHPILHRDWEKIEKEITEGVHRAQAFEGVQDILNKVKSDILGQRNLWGSWFGRIVNEKKPQEYLDIDITGVERTNELVFNLSLVLGNKVVLQEGATFSIDTNIEDTIDKVLKDILQKYEKFIYDCTDKMDFTENRGLQLHSPFSGASLEDHYHILNETGYTAFPENESLSNQDIQKPQQDNISIHHRRRGR